MSKYPWYEKYIDVCVDGVKVGEVKVDYYLIEALYGLKGAVGHAVKKLLRTGSKPGRRDLEEAVDALQTELRHPKVVETDVSTGKKSIAYHLSTFSDEESLRHDE